MNFKRKKLPKCLVKNATSAHITKQVSANIEKIAEINILMMFAKTLSARVPGKNDILKNASSLKIKIIADFRKLVHTDTWKKRVLSTKII